MDPLLVGAAFVAGFAGQAHCAAMCGPLVTILERAAGTSTKPPWRRRLGYQSGRLMSYCVLGALVAALGSGASVVLAPGLATMTLRLAAALAVLIVGLALLGYREPLSVLQPAARFVWQQLAPLTRRVMPMTSLPKAVAAGMLWGLMPCGLVYGALLLTLAGGSSSLGALAMAGFWAGTLPVTLALGAGAGLAPTQPATRQLLGGALVALAAYSVGTELTIIAAAARAPNWQSAMLALCSA